MKKLLVTAIGAAVAFGAFADAVRFEESTAGTVTALSQLPGGTSLWSEPEGATNTYAIGAAGTVSAPLSIASSETQPTQALDIKTTFGKPLSLNAVSGGATTNINDGLYFDSLVKFTVCEDAPADTYSGAKIIMWLQEVQDANGNATGTNLIVRAGYLSGGDTVAATPTNYVCALPNGFNADAWHRVTIKAIADITTTERGVPGFAIYLDQNGDTATSDINAGTANMWDDSFPASELTEAASLLNDSRALFPSLDVTSGNKATLTSASFDGTGSITDLIFTDNGPAFAQDMAAPKASVTIGTTTTSYSTLAEAVAAVNGVTSGDVTFQLSKGMTIGETLAFASTANVVLDFAGCVLTNEADTAAISNEGMLTITNSVGNGGIRSDAEGAGVALVDDGNGSLTITAGSFWGTVSLAEDGTYSISGGSFKDDTDLEVEGCLAEGKSLVLNSETGLYDVVDYVPPVLPTVAENPWYESPGAIVLAQDLPGQTGNIVSAFHGQGEGEYLGLTYSTNPLQFDLYQVDGTNALTIVTSVQSNNAAFAAAGQVPGFRGVAISKTLGIAMTLGYSKTYTMYAFPLAGGDPTAVVKSADHAFDAGAFSPDGKYFFSNAIAGESSNQFYVKWSVSVDGDTGALALTKVGSISAGGRGRSMAYAKINGRDLVFGLVDTGKVVVMDMTGDDSTAWTKTDLITDLPAHSYGTLCVSGVNVVDDQGDPATPHLTVATSTNNGATKVDVLNVYALTIPATGTVTASLTKSFDEDALTAAGFGDISDANRYGNTVYVTDDEATIYFARPDNKLYAGQFAYVVKFVVDGVTNSVPVFPGATVAQANPTKENYIFDGWFLPGAGQAFDLSTPVTQDLTLEAQFTAAEAKIGSALYLTLKDAIDAADTGDTVTVLKDCVVNNGNTGITFTKGINLVNNYTITVDGANYAFRVANGTTTPVTWSGTGSLVWLKGSGSPIIVGSNEKKATYGINEFYEGSFVLNGGTLTSTDATAKGGNLVKLEAGTFVLNDGTINGGTRGVKADSEGNNATCVLTINGGTIVNTNTAAIAASTAGSGSSTVTVNAGTFTGAIVGTGMVTIPGTSTAKFDRDQSAFCESGYETTLSDGWYVVTAVKPSGIDPASATPSADVTAADADAAIAAVEVEAPAEAGSTPEAKAAYKDLFTYTAVETSAGSGVYTVTLTGIKEEVQEAVSKDAVDVLTSDEATVDVPAGLCYKVTTYTALGGGAVETKSGTSDGTAIPVAKPGTTQGFIKVELATKPLN